MIMRFETKHILFLLLILGIAATFRFIGLNWDQNSHLHPDERFLTMVTTNISWPNSLSQYFDTAASPLNPHNKGFSFYVYGTYPVHLTKAVAYVLHKDTYDGITLVGRALSGLADTITVVIVFLIASYLGKKTGAGILAAFCYTISVLPIQTSHFFTVDPYVTLWTTIALWHIVRGKFGLPLGIVVGLAIAAKISAILILPIVVLTVIATWPWKREPARAKKRKQLLWQALLVGIGMITTVRIMYPYVFDGWKLNELVLANWRQLASFDSITTTFPPGIQWIGVSSWQPLMDLITWGLGLPLGLLTALSLVLCLYTFFRTRKWHPEYVVWAWAVLIITYQSFQFAKPMRYLWPAYPALAVLSGMFLSRIFQLVSKTVIFGRWVNGFLCLLLLLWPLSYVSIYVRPHTRVAASNWIYTHIPAGQTIAWEHWDDPLPLPINGYNSSGYHQIQLPSFDPDDAVKWKKIQAILSQSDYLVLSSNRAYGALGRADYRFPISNRFYRQLFSGDLGFRLVAQFTSRPMLPLPAPALCFHLPGFSYGSIARELEQCDGKGIHIVDDYADETFTVYDHPKVLIFQKQTNQARL